MKADPKTTKILTMTIMAAAAATFVWTGCDSHSEDGHAASDGGVHSSPYPTCTAIIAACHPVDAEEGAIHDCHDKAHDAKSDSDCVSDKDRCVKLCNEAAADAGGDGHDGGADGGAGH